MTDKKYGKTNEERHLLIKKKWQEVDRIRKEIDDIKDEINKSLEEESELYMHFLKQPEWWQAKFVYVFFYIVYKDNFEVKRLLDSSVYAQDGEDTLSLRVKIFNRIAKEHTEEYINQMLDTHLVFKQTAEKVYNSIMKHTLVKRCPDGFYDDVDDFFLLKEYIPENHLGDNACRLKNCLWRFKCDTTESGYRHLYFSGMRLTYPIGAKGSNAQVGYVLKDGWANIVRLEK